MALWPMLIEPSLQVMFDFASLVSFVYLLVYLIPLGLLIYWLNFFYKKSQELTRKVDAIQKSLDEILQKSSPVPEDKNGQ